MAEITLSEFVGEALSQILLGIDDAKSKLRESGKAGWVSPAIIYIGKGEESLNQTVRAEFPSGGSGDAHLVWFDIAVSASEGSEKGGKIRVLSSILGGEFGGKKTVDIGSVSRIRFSIPLFLAEPPSAAKDQHTRVSGDYQTEALD